MSFAMRFYLNIKKVSKKKVSDNLQLINEFAGQYDRLKQKLPYHINVIDELHVNENAHSRILCKLLQCQSENGNYDFLESLITYIVSAKHKKNFSKINIKSPIITQEKERIDLWVKDENNAIIFENKVYDANDQEAQIARYIVKTKNYRYEEDNIFVVYMPSREEHEESEQTWIDTSDSQNPVNYKEFFKERYVKLSFREDILKWLKESVLPNIKYKDSYLLHAVSQYIDYLEGYFDLRTINKEMNMELQQILIEKLGLNEKTPEEVLKVLDEKTSEINKLLSQLEIIKTHKKQELAKKDFDSLKSYVLESKFEAQLGSISSKFDIQSKCGFIEDSHFRFYLSFKKYEWKELSLVIEKWAYDNHQMFIYIGIPGEKDTKKEYLENRDNKMIFKESSEKENHPYGWAWIDEYNAKPKEFMEAIKNGSFIKYLEEKVDETLNAINEKQLDM